MDTALEDRVRDAYRAHLRKEAARMFSGNGHTAYALKKWVQDEFDRDFPSVLSGVDTLLRSSVARTTLILVDTQPIPRTQLKCGKRRFTVDPYALLRSGVEAAGRMYNATRAAEALKDVLELPMAVLAADVASSVSRALTDEELTRPIRDKLAKQRALARENALAQVKHLFRNVQDLVTKDDVAGAWDEVLVSKVMES